jgi:hypothetical protein
MRWREGLRLLWLVPPLAAGGMFVRSFRVMDEVSAVDRDNVLRAAVSYRGAVHFFRAEHNATPRAVGWDPTRVPAGATWGDLYPLGDQDWRVMGTARHSSRTGTGTGAAVAPVLWTAGPVGPRARLAPWLLTHPYVAYAVPYWVVLAATAPPGVIAVVRVARGSRRRRRGLCAACGYDLRATTAGRCPECGEATVPRGT